MSESVKPFHTLGDDEAASTLYTDRINKLRATFASGKTKKIEWRMHQLRQLEKFIRDHYDTFLEACTQDLRKNRMESILFEVEFTLNDVRGALMDVREWVKPEAASKTPMTIMDKPYIHNEPFGVALVLGAWNYPIQLLLAPLVGAISAGNCAVLKPSELAPNVAKIMESLVPKYLDPDAFLVINGGVQESSELLKERFDFIFYTGSINVGKIVYAAAQKNLTPVALELGGKSPVYIDSNVDLDIATKRILWGKYANAGQTCVAPDYILCSESIYDQFIDTCKTVVKQYYGDDPKESPDYGRIVTARHAKRLESMMPSTNIVYGGVVDSQNRYVAPTLIRDVKKTDPIMKEEIFGPILPLLKVKDMTEAIDFINSRDKPLTAYVFTKDRKVINRFINETSSGSVCANDVLVHLACDSLPFGGVGQSGIGKYHGKFSFDCFSNKKAILVRDFNPIGEFLGSKRYPPVTQGNIALFKQLMAKRSNPFSLLGKVLPYLVGVAVGVGGTVLYNYLKISQDKRQ